MKCLNGKNVKCKYQFKVRFTKGRFNKGTGIMAIFFFNYNSGRNSI